MKTFYKAFFIEFWVTAGDFLKKIFIELNEDRFTLVPISKRMGGAEKTASFSESRSDCMERVSGRSSPKGQKDSTVEEFTRQKFLLLVV